MRTEVKQKLKFDGLKRDSDEVMCVLKNKLVIPGQEHRLLGVTGPGGNSRTKNDGGISPYREKSRGGRRREATGVESEGTRTHKSFDRTWFLSGKHGQVKSYYPDEEKSSALEHLDTRVSEE